MIHARLVPAVAVCAALILVAGCGGSEPPDEKAGTAAPPTAPAPAPAGGEDLLEAYRAPEPDKVVATVNGAPILAREVWDMAGTMLLTLEAQGQPVTEDMKLNARRFALQSQVADELLYQAGRAAGIEVSHEDVASETEKRKAALGGEEEFQRFVQTSGRTEEELIDKLRRRLTIDRFVAKKMEDLKVPPELARKFYDENPDLFQEGEQARVAFVFVESRAEDPAPKRADAKQRVDEAHAKAQAGEDFAEIAKAYSQASSAAHGGDSGFFSRGVMPPAFENLAFTLPLEEISPVFETPQGYNFLKVTARRDSYLPPYDDVRSAIAVQLLQQAERESMQAIVMSLANQATIDVLEPDLKPESGAGIGQGGAAQEAPSAP